MSLRTVVQHVPWRQCIRKSLSTIPKRVQNQSELPNATELTKILSGKELPPQNPSTLDFLSQEVLKNPFTLDTAPKKIIKPVVAEPVAEGYDAKAYNKAMDIVKEGRNPTPQELTDLLRLMDFDSPLGEMKPEAHAIWKEIRSKGVISTIGGYIALLNLAGKVGDTLMQDEICQVLPEDDIPLTPKMVHHLLEGLKNNHEIERAIFLFRDIRARGIDCRHRTYKFMISMCVESNESEEAFRILIDLHESFGDTGVSEHLWWMVLEVCARNGQLDGTLHCWQHIQNIPHVVIPEGLCLHVLSTAAQHGHPALATSAFSALSNLGVTYSTHHFLPLIEAYAQSNEIRQAFIVLGIMRESSTSPPQLHHLSFLTSKIAKSTESLDRAFFILQDIVQKEGKRADITAFNIIISACISLNDASRAISTYRDASSLKITPNLDTYNLLLHAAQKVGHKDLAMYILSDLKEAQITPDHTTYAHVILTYLAQPDAEYDQAFLYLEEMKSAGFIPASGIYATFVKKCVYHSDERAVTLVQEMKKLGYQTKHLEQYVERAAKSGASSRVLKGSKMAELRRETGREGAEMTEYQLRNRRREGSLKLLSQTRDGRDSLVDVFDL